MKWIKEILVDILVTLFIIGTALTGYPWMYWIIAGYTGILLFAKAVVLFADDSLQLIRKTQTGAPDWVNHLLYGINTAVMIYLQWWYLIGGWIGIWILSELARQRVKSKTGTG